jgi:hypothetical protein
VADTVKYVGWPFENYAVNLRRWGSSRSGGSGTRVALATPRHKHTFFIEFILGQGVSKVLTSAKEFISNDAIYGQLKSVDLPKPKLATDTLRSYTRYYKIQKKIEYEPITLRFHDDSTSMVTALIKDMIAFVNYSGELGADLRKGDLYTDEFSKFTNNLTGPNSLVDSDYVRSQMETRPSLGMKLRDCGRMFLESIIVYDLGTEPDSINIYTYMNPHLVSVDPEGRDQTESGIAEVSMSFEFENYQFSVGQPKNAVKAFIDSKLGIPEGLAGSPNYTNADGHASMDDLDLGDDPACMAANCTPSEDSYIRGPNQDLQSSTLDRTVLGNYISNRSDPRVVGPDGGPGGAQSIDPRTGKPYAEADFANSAGAALAYYQDKLQKARDSYNGIAGKGIVSPQVEQYRREQIKVLEQQVAAVQQFQNGVDSGRTLPFGVDTNSATLNSARAILGGVGALVGINGQDVQSINNAISQNVINAKKIALEAQAKIHDTGRDNALAQQSLAKSPAENQQLANDAETHRLEAQRLRAQAAAISAPPQFPSYMPENYGNGQATAGGVISGITRAVALQAIGHFLSTRGI